MKKETTEEAVKHGPKTLHFKLHFTEFVLGTSASNPNIYKEFIANKAPTPEQAEEEVEAVDANTEFEKAMTVFPRTEDGAPFFWDYQIKGFFKDTCNGLRRIEGSASSKIKAYKKEIDKLVFTQPRRIPIHFDGDAQTLQRPLRASTAQGERVALAASEMVPAGASCEVDVLMLTDTYDKAVHEWMEYGQLSGIGQWRNSGAGRFLYEEFDGAGNRIGGNWKG